MKKFYSQEEIDCMAEILCMDIEDHGWLCEDGHWLTDEEFKAWTDKEIVEAYELAYPMFVA